MMVHTLVDKQQTLSITVAKRMLFFVFIHVEHEDMFQILVKATQAKHCIYKSSFLDGDICWFISYNSISYFFPHHIHIFYVYK